MGHMPVMQCSGRLTSKVQVNLHQAKNNNQNQEHMNVLRLQGTEVVIVSDLRQTLGNQMCVCLMQAPHNTVQHSQSYYLLYGWCN